MKSLSYLSLPAILSVFLLGAAQSVHANTTENSTKSSNLVMDTLVLTEEAIAQMRINPEESKAKINQALTLVKSIESYYSQNTSAKLTEEDSTVMASSYVHYYPKVDLSLLDHEHQLPTLSYKLKSNIVYHGDAQERATLDNLFFDYTFAKASLVTAREAISSDHSLEAMANLRRVFEAIYIDPDFSVSPTNN